MSNAEDEAFRAMVRPTEIRALVAPATYAKGQEYYAEGRVVDLVRAQSNRYEAQVRGQLTYNVAITVGARRGYFCDCPAHASSGFCKHLVAAALAIAKALGVSARSTMRILRYDERSALTRATLLPHELLEAEKFPALKAQLDAGTPPLRDLMAQPVRAVEQGLFETAALVALLTERGAALKAELAVQQALQTEREIDALAQAAQGPREFVALAVEELRRLSPFMRERWMSEFEDVEVSFTGGRRGVLKIFDVELSLSTWRDGALAWKLPVGATPYANAQALVLVKTALQALADAEHPLHTRVLAAVSRGDEEAILQGLDELLAQAVDDVPARTHVLSWRFESTPTGYFVEPYVHKPTAKGFSAGTRLRDERDARLALLPQDELAFARHNVYDKLFALIGHPRVTCDGDTYAVRAGQVSVRAVDLSHDRVALHVYLDETVIDPTSLYREIAVGRDDLRHVLSIARLNVFERGLVQHLESAPAVLPLAQKQALLERVMALEQRVAVGLGASLRGDFVEPSLQMVARFSSFAGGLRMELLVEPLGEGLGFVPGGGQVEVSRMQDGQRVYTVRHLEDERAQALRTWAALGLEGDFATGLLETEALLDALSALREQQVRVDWPRQLPKPFVSTFAQLSQMQVAVTKKRDWFSLDGVVDVDGEQVALARVALALREQKKYVALDDGRYLRIASDLRERLAPIEAMGERFGVSAAMAIAELADAGVQYEAHPDFEAMVQRIRAAEHVVHSVPTTLQATLRPYQTEGFVWLARLADWGIGGVLADDMGLGKTVQAIALLLHRPGPSLIVAPTSVAFNWQRELERFAPSLKDVTIVSYGVMTREIERLEKTHFATVVFDEAHALKNPDAQRTQAARRLQRDLAIGLTGTPIENRLGELWSLFRIVAPGLLGDAESFRARFAIPIEQKRDAHARKLLGGITAPFILRRTKGVVAPELPAKTEINMPIALTPRETALYDTLRAQKLTALRKQTDALTGQKARIAILAALTELRMAACDPRLIDPSAPTGSKLEEIVRLCDELRQNGHRALVFSQFTRFLDVIEEALEDFTFFRLDGSVPPAERAKRVDAFERGEGDVFLLSLQAGGTGLNLTSADYVILVDPWWNPAVEDQAAGRAHRIGQQKPVTVYRLFSKGTIEEKILAMHAEKRDLVNSVMDNASTAPPSVSSDDLLALLSGG